MDLSDLIASLIPCSDVAEESASTLNLCHDSRTVQQGDIFVAVKGSSVDGHDFIPDAIKRGAATVVAQQPIAVPDNVELVLVEDSACALGVLAQAIHGKPAEFLTMLGVTGTNGKTTVAYLTQAMLNAAGIPAGMIGTVAYDTGGPQNIPANNTTPDSLRLAQMMACMRHCGRKAMVMECSSHGLDQKRTAGINFNAAAFTNLTGDHLDYHGTAEAYLNAKAKLFESLNSDAVAILNSQDPASETLVQRTNAKVWQYAVNPQNMTAQITAQIKDMGLWGCDLKLNILGESTDLRFALPGEHNVSNLLAAAGLAYAAGVPLETIADSARNFTGVPGRLERVDAGQDFTVLVDYAHTDDALANVLQAISALNPNRIILVFGCGGDRDRSKRSRMAHVAQQYSQEIIVTNDNPRTEDQKQIFDDIRKGFDPTLNAQHIHEIPDRRSAIAHAIDLAQTGDVVLIAGKGHEDYQLIGNQKLDFDDRVAALELLNAVRPASQNNIDNIANATNGGTKRQPAM